MTRKEQEIAQLNKDWSENPRWRGIPARLHRRRRGPPARQREDRAHAGEAGRREALEAVQRAAVREFARRAHRQPGDAAGQGRRAGDLSLGLAGRGRRQRFALDVPGPVAVRGFLGSHGGEAHQQRARACRPDPDDGRQRRHRLVTRPSWRMPSPASAAC